MDANALNSLGYMLAERGDRLDEAVTLLQRALKIEPGNPSYLDSLGWAYFQQGRLDLADPPLTEAAEKLQDNSVVQDHLGDLRFKQRRFADAAAAWERALGGDGQSIDKRENPGQDSRGSRPDVSRRIRLLPAVLCLVIASCAPRIVALPVRRRDGFSRLRARLRARRPNACRRVRTPGGCAVDFRSRLPPTAARQA